MPLPWVRLDANIGTHDKILSLLSQPSGEKAFVLYVCALGYAGAHGTDGHIPKYALKVNHGSEKLARMLIDHRLWEYNGDGGFVIRNWELRQELMSTTEAKGRSASVAAKKANCVRWHGEGCGCWKESEQ